MKVLAILYSGGKFASEQPKLLGTTENKLGIEKYLKDQGHELVVSDSKEGPDSDFQKHIKDAEILITTPFHPGYLTKEIMDTAKNLKLCVTAGVGSDHIDLNAANERKITVAEVSGSNVVSVAEHVVMTILLLVRNYGPAHDQIVRGTEGGWNVAAIARDAYDVEGKVIGTIGAGRIGFRVLQRMLPFNPKELLYYDYTALPAAAEKEVKARRVEDLKEFLGACDIVTVNCPLHEGTKDLLNKETISYLKPGAWVVNTARGAIVNAEAMRDAVESGKVAGYGGDVWNKQPAGDSHPWRSMQNSHSGGNGMVPHYSGTTLDAQQRYAAGTKEIIDNYLNKKPQNPANVIVENGQYASKAYGQRK